ncbi:MAG: hypothetical protein M4579_000770 [Chaenotheca gracillima]|nr:MAG: hypothetical protein M4579_000770 [Chaenotheca gracillima]
MEDPVREIPGVIHALCKTPPKIQQETIDTYFTPDARFLHPFCRAGPSDNSRWLIWAIFRWYKTMSPHVDLEVESVAFDAGKKRLYVSIHQSFGIWFVPFWGNARVKLVTVLDLLYNKERKVYLIDSQEDLYQTNECLRFLIPGGAFIWSLFQILATYLCVLGTFVFWPVTMWEGKARIG